MRSCAWLLCVVLLLGGGAPTLLVVHAKTKRKGMTTKTKTKRKGKLTTTTTTTTKTDLYLYEPSGSPFVREYLLDGKNATRDFRTSTAPRVVQFYSPFCVRPFLCVVCMCAVCV
jgi:hypothetical protein